MTLFFGGKGLVWWGLRAGGGGFLGAWGLTRVLGLTRLAPPERNRGLEYSTQAPAIRQHPQMQGEQWRLLQKNLYQSELGAFR